MSRNMRRARIDLAARGLRSPRHTGLVTCNAQRLYPFMAAPLRPMETLAGMSINGQAFLNLMSRLGTTCPVGWELGVWKIPLSTLGDAFVALVANDAEDVADITNITNFVNPGTTVPATPSTATSDSHLSGTAISTATRAWAGEIGLPDSSMGAGESDAAYVRYVSEATWKVARTFYELETDGIIPGTDEDERDVPPLIADPIRGATYSGMWAGGTNTQGADQTPDNFTPEAPFGQSLSEWAERLSLLGSPNLSYSDWLKSFGVDIRRVGSIPEPVLYRRGVLRPYGSPVSWSYAGNWSSTLTNDVDDDAMAGRRIVAHAEGQDSYGNSVIYYDEATPPDSGLVFSGDRAGISKYGATIRLRKRRNIICDEPSILLGCFMWSPWMYRASQFAHHLDITRILNARHWGPPFGGIDEQDFLTAQVINGPTGLGQADEDEGGVESSIRAMNLLNLYMNGDAFCNNTDRWGWAGPMQEDGDSTTDSLMRVDASFDVRLAILTDMVQ